MMTKLYSYGKYRITGAYDMESKTQPGFAREAKQAPNIYIFLILN